MPNPDTQSNEHHNCVICNATITEKDGGLCDEHKYDEQLTSPTQSDKTKELDLSHLKDLRAVLKWSYDHGLLKGEYPDSDSGDKQYILDEGEKRLMQLLTAREERMVREARINELYELTNQDGGGDDFLADAPMIRAYIENRLATLTNQLNKEQ